MNEDFTVALSNMMKIYASIGKEIERFKEWYLDREKKLATLKEEEVQGPDYQTINTDETWPLSISTAAFEAAAINDLTFRIIQRDCGCQMEPISQVV